MAQEHLAQSLQDRCRVEVCTDKLKSHLQKRFSRVFEGVDKPGDSASLTQLYTELYITEGVASEFNQEHEVRHLESASRRAATLEKSITCEDMFKARPHSLEPIRVVLMKGVAGVGKTVLTQKFSLDWAEGRAHQELQLLFPFTFRELNVLRDSQFSLVELLHHFFSPSKDLCSFDQLQVLFILDGLDECRIPLDFVRTRILSDPTESVSVDVLLVNLIRGRLLPSARLWITTRPAAANQIPERLISMVTEVRGFTDPQKEQYFRKWFRYEWQVTRIISHIKSIRSLHIMCKIPVFCWILSTVLTFLEQTNRSELPRTLTWIYVHFLGAKVHNIQYYLGSGEYLHWTPETREMVQSLGKLAFKQLQKGNRIFYEFDLSECGLDTAAVARYSGVFTHVFREEPGLYQNKVYCFIHLSVQEFLAALHVHLTFFRSGQNLLEPQHPVITESVFYGCAMDQALQSPNGHLDLFLHFLLGLPLLTNHSLLQILLASMRSDRLIWLLQFAETKTGPRAWTVNYIKQKLNEEGLSAERSLNLLHCLKELDDFSLLEEIQKYMREGPLSDKRMSPAQWSALCFLLLSSDSDLEEFNLHKYCASEEVLLRLLPVVKVSNIALLNFCNLSLRCCGPLASALTSSSLTYLDLSHNDLQDSGVELLCEGLESALCRLETLRLAACLVSERGGTALASALSSAHSHLRTLDLSHNHPGPSAEKLTALREDPHCPLQTVRLEPSGPQWLSPGLQKYYTHVTLDPDTVNEFLQLSDDQRGVTSVRERQLRPHSSQRFEWPQVLSASPLIGRCYLEVRWSGGVVDVAVGYRDIQRRGKRSKCEFGIDHRSWRLRISLTGFSVCHNDIETVVSSSASSRSFTSGRVGVFLDSDSLSFYDISSGGSVLIHTFDTTFTEPVFVGFWLVNHGSSVSLVDMTRRPQVTGTPSESSR